MKNDIIIKDINVNFSEYFISKGISSDTQSKLNTTDILAVPTAYGDHEFYFAQETINFLKYCRNNSSEHSFDVLAEDDIQIRSLHSLASLSL